MKITKIEVIPFGIPIKDFADAYAGFASSNAVLVKIHTDEGTVGIGEAIITEIRMSSKNFFSRSV
jgi:L-alanine-DL-glutamate epimerase-like enolase superfamily enzyme